MATASQATDALEQFYNSERLKIPENTKSIRVLILECTSTTQDDSNVKELRGSLRVVNLAQSPSFTTLSYVWGTDSKALTEHISCDGFLLGITRNCYEALISLRAQHDGPSLTIWVDSICINQVNLQERNNQVQLMGEVYSWAEIVYIWLGPGNDMSNSAFECILATPINELCLVGTSWTATPKQRRRLWKDGFAILLECFRAIYGKRKSLMRYNGSFEKTAMVQMYSRETFEDLLTREWINRAWTFQELILACRPVIVCGKKSVSWDVFIRSIKFLEFYYKRQTEYYGNAWRLPPHFQNWSHLIRLWMHIDRKTHWNGSEIRKTVEYHSLSDVLLSGAAGRGPITRAHGSSFFAYQQVAKTFVKKWERSLTFGPYVVLIFFMIPVMYMSAVNSRQHRILMIILGVLLFLLNFAIWYCLHAFRWKIFILLPEDNSAIEYDLATEAVLRALRSRDVGDPKDRGYAYYGILELIGVKFDPPKYESSIGEMYQDLFTKLLQLTGNLNLLLDAGAPEFPGSPSWVPRWDNLGTKSWIDSEAIYNVRGTKALWHPEWDGIVLGPLLGVRAMFQGGDITFRSANFRHVTDIQENTTDHLWNIWAFTEWISKVRQDIRMTHIETSLSGCIYEILHAGRPVEDKTKQFNQWLKFMNGSIAESIIGQLRDDDAVAKYYLEQCQTLARDRILFITSRGFVGTASPAVVTGDLIARVEGVSMRVVLRPDGDSQYKYIGPCFMYGFRMYGDDDPEGETEYSHIVLS